MSSQDTPDPDHRLSCGASIHSARAIYMITAGSIIGSHTDHEEDPLVTITLRRSQAEDLLRILEDALGNHEDSSAQGEDQ